VFGVLSTNLDGPMFNFFSFVIQQLKWGRGHLVSRHPVFVFVLFLTSVNHLAQPEWLILVCADAAIFLASVCVSVFMSSGVAAQVQEEMVFLERRKACSIVCVDAALVLVGVCVCVCVCLQMQ
jgi:hypothetical protein